MNLKFLMVEKFVQKEMDLIMKLKEKEQILEAKDFSMRDLKSEAHLLKKKVESLESFISKSELFQYNIY